MTIQTIAQEFYDAFETATRDNGEEFVKLRDGSPEWMTDAIRDAHDYAQRMPEDHIYSLCQDAAGFIADNEDADEYGGEFADTAVSVYTADRYRWLADHLDNARYVDEAQEEGLVGEGASISDRIGAGMYLQAREVYSAIYQALEAQAEEMEEDADDE